MTPQQIFDKVTTHLFTQGVAAIDPQGCNCAYLSSDGLMCAVGCLMDSDTYDARFEGFSLGSLVEEFGTEELPPVLRDNFTLLSQLQTVHDHEMPRFKITEAQAQNEEFVIDNEIYVKDMKAVAKGLRCIACEQNLYFDEALVPERFRDAG